MTFNNLLQVSPGAEVILPWVLVGILAVICVALSALLIKMHSARKTVTENRDEAAVAVMPESTAEAEPKTQAEDADFPEESDVYKWVGKLTDKVNGAIEILNNARGGVSVDYLEQEIGVAINKLKSIWEEK